MAPVGTGYAISLDLSSASGSGTLASFQGTADGPKDLLNVVDQLSRKLRARMGESLKRVQKTVPLEQATTASLPALQEYSEATRANDLDQDFDVAEISCSSYIAARDKGFPFCAIPVFPHRRFRHGFIFINTQKGIKKPTDLIGKKFGVTRERIRQLQNIALMKLRRALQKKEKPIDHLLPSHVAEEE